MNHKGEKQGIGPEKIRQAIDDRKGVLSEIGRNLQNKIFAAIVTTLVFTGCDPYSGKDGGRDNIALNSRAEEGKVLEAVAAMLDERNNRIILTFYSYTQEPVEVVVNFKNNVRPPISQMINTKLGWVDYNINGLDTSFVENLRLYILGQQGRKLLKDLDMSFANDDNKIIYTPKSQDNSEDEQ